MWHVSSRSSVVTLRTAIHLLLTYLQFVNYVKCMTYLGYTQHARRNSVDRYTVKR